MTEHQFQAPQRPQDCFDWITRETVTMLVARAFELACREAHPPHGERFIDLNGGWSTRAAFASDLARFFEWQLKTEAHLLGVDGGEFEGEFAAWMRKRGLALPDLAAHVRSEVQPPPVSTTHREVTQ
jgi:hypothetical protein